MTQGLEEKSAGGGAVASHATRKKERRDYAVAAVPKDSSTPFSFTRMRGLDSMWHFEQ